MTDLAALEAAVRAAPRDAAPRLILADFVQEREDFRYAESLRHERAEEWVVKYNDSFSDLRWPAGDGWSLRRWVVLCCYVTRKNALSCRAENLIGSEERKAVARMFRARLFEHPQKLTKGPILIGEVK